MKDNITRRHFLERTSLAGAGLSLALPQLTGHSGTASAAEAASGKPAKLGGKPTCSGGWPGWPVRDETEEKALLGTLHSGQWFRGSGKAVAASKMPTRNSPAPRTVSPPPAAPPPFI